MNRAKAEFFDAQVAAGWAAEEYGDTERPKLERLLQQSELQPGHWVLEPGCGTGRLSEVLAQVVGPTGHLVATDISQGMVTACRKRVAGLSWVRVERLAVEDYHAPAIGFDRVVCHQVFPHFDDQPAALAHMVKLLKPAGVLTVVHFMPSAVINDTHRKAGTVVEKDMLPPPEEMRRMIKQAGLELETLADDELGYLLKARLPSA
ncbi:MAG: class I SAM-dependent methyltransferase [Desulfarculus sp.]|nr:class I SAM-dependent methyltransferase [Pseudomonadota bacterium]MBV1716451.1 class I SAM-dependent methyltransferase [Desulfarculus sp.]MBU4576651.1 class I SAM-dependent methyltransferase [Pseudomonadota bacterium]MBU4598600.1 class I SAM-dependent methyltransferase [Pseudomonadota bacterium]MBV1736935.1 class I SAM-dependent methyltransferase [Desulfarculus sp.]